MTWEVFALNDMSSVIHLLLPPNHLVDHAGVALDEFDDLGADVFVGVGWHWNTVILVLYHFNCHVYCLEKIVLIDSCKDETSLIKCFWTFS